MATAKITLIGFNNYLEAQNDDLFEYLSVPTGIDRSLLINNILLKGGEFEVLYSDPNFLKNMIGVWSAKWLHTMERWVNALSIDYNPLENYDRMEDWTDTGSKISSMNTKETDSTNATNNNVKQSGTVEDTSRNESAIGNDYSESEGSGSTTNTRSAFDSSDYSPHDKSDTSSDGKNISSSLTSADGKTNSNINTLDIDSGTNNVSGNKSSDANAIDNTAGVHSGRMHGNIGVTTSQQMLQAELDIAKWNLYDEIADLFISEFCIYLY